MNFSRRLYYKSFLEHLLGIPQKEYLQKAPKVSENLEMQIDAIYKIQAEGYWGITRGDKAFIRALGEIKKSLYHNRYRKRFKRTVRNLNAIAERKLKIVFFAQETVCWPSLESIYLACKKDERFITDLVYVPFEHVNADKTTDYFKIYKEDMRLPIISHDQYSLTEESPDVAVFVKPYDSVPKQYYIREVSKVVRRCVYIRYGFEIAAYNVDLHFRLPLQHKAWRFIAYGDKVKELAELYAPNKGKNVVVWGHPRADHYRNLEKDRKSIPEEWKAKIRGRKTVLWNTQHTVRKGEGSGTFFKWKDEVFSYFENNTDMVLLWRPHPLMFGALVNSGLVTEAELDELVTSAAGKDNVILDRSQDYRNSFYASDAIITDGTAFLIEYFYTGRPLIFTPKDGAGDIYFRDEICDNVYVAREKGDMSGLLDNVKRGLDPIRGKRLAFGKKLLRVNPEGNGEYIKNRIYSELAAEVEDESLRAMNGGAPCNDSCYIKDMILQNKGNVFTAKAVPDSGAEYERLVFYFLIKKDGFDYIRSPDNESDEFTFELSEPAVYDIICCARDSYGEEETFMYRERFIIE